MRRILDYGDNRSITVGYEIHGGYWCTALQDFGSVEDFSLKLAKTDPFY